MPIQQKLPPPVLFFSDFAGWEFYPTFSFVIRNTYKNRQRAVHESRQREEHICKHVFLQYFTLGNLGCVLLKNFSCNLRISVCLADNDVFYNRKFAKIRTHFPLFRLPGRCLMCSVKRICFQVVQQLKEIPENTIETTRNTS